MTLSHHSCKEVLTVVLCPLHALPSVDIDQFNLEILQSI